MKAFFLPTDEDDFADIFSHPKVQSAFEQAVGNALRKHLPTSAPSFSDDDLLDVDQAALFLKIARQTVYELTSTRRIPHLKKGRRLYFKRIDLQKWLESGRRKTKSEIEVEAENDVRFTNKRR